MLVHTRKHHTRKHHTTKKKMPLSTPPEDFIPWREVEKEEIAKYTEIGLMIRGGRYKAGLTQKELAELISVHPHHISEMEHGKRPIGKKMAYRLADIFDVDYKVFL